MSGGLGIFSLGAFQRELLLLQQLLFAMLLLSLQDQLLLRLPVILLSNWGVFSFRNLNDAPKPKATVANLCVAKATTKGKLKISNIAGSCITPAPPPEKAENKLDIRDIKNRERCSNTLLSSYHRSNPFISK